MRGRINSGRRRHSDSDDPIPPARHAHTDDRTFSQTRIGAAAAASPSPEVMDATIRAVIVDDEPPARRRIRRLLEREPDVEIIAECGNGRDAATAIEAGQPDLVFLDVQMPEVDGFAVFERVGLQQMPLTIFTTAYSEFAIRAFDVKAVDYLLKPIDPARFREAMERARERLRLEHLDHTVLSAASTIPTPHATSTPTIASSIAVRTDGRIWFVPVEQIEYCQTAGNYVELHAAGRAYMLRGSMAGLESRLDPSQFLRIHRSVIVNVRRIEHLEPLFHGEYVVTLRGGKKLTSGRRYRGRINQALGLSQTS